MSNSEANPQMGKKTRLLFVDDEESIRITLPAILQREGFDVTSAGTVREALELITQQQFDVLLTDLNIGNPGDGFTVVSAMRRTQPTAATFILTGYPDFQTALEAIRQQVDDYLTKPADINKLVEKMKGKLNQPRHLRQQPPKRLAALISDNAERIVNDWLEAVKKDEELRSVRLTDQEYVDHLPWVLQSLILALNGEKPEAAAEALNAAAKHGVERKKHGYNIPMLVREAGILHNVISGILQESLLEVDLSTVIGDSMKMGENLNGSLEQSIRAFQKHTRQDNAA